MRVNCEKCNRFSFRVASGLGTYCVHCLHDLEKPKVNDSTISVEVTHTPDIPKIVDFLEETQEGPLVKGSSVLEELLFVTVDNFGGNMSPPPPGTIFLDNNRLVVRIGSTSGVSISQIEEELFGLETTLSKDVFIQKIEEYHKKHPEYFECLDIMHKKAYPKE